MHVPNTKGSQESHDLFEKKLKNIKNACPTKTPVNMLKFSGSLTST